MEKLRQMDIIVLLIHPAFCPKPSLFEAKTIVKIEFHFCRKYEHNNQKGIVPWRNENDVMHDGGVSVELTHGTI
ncbi:hypothetical protein BpHYR1_033613 [Brachionus plicatilis]|uniref:Uncharacterized protein n=1 Tax=Brachionus plicatilis TaxID=10195 RepID=A0A3M7S3N5_BRAPC|nr:hypothetical protein BpHYR1_033613 [Brachionus plicatilis]